VHGFVLMTNHHHLLLETPQGNRGMGWLQNAFTRRMNTRHRLWGHLFGGRYKAILVEPGNCCWALLDYIHLNPVRAGIVQESPGIEWYEWSSLPHYLGPARKRPPWMETATGFEVCGCADTASGRRQFLSLLERRVDWRNPRLAGTSFPDGDGKPELAVSSSLRRGWLFASERFREKLLRMLAKRAGRIEKANGYHGPQLNDYGEKRAGALIRAALEHFGTDLPNAPTGAQGRLAERVSGGHDSEGNDDETGLDQRAVEHRDPRGNQPAGHRNPKTPRHRPKLAATGRSSIENCNVKWLTPFRSPL
jgi:putative transposase